MSELTKRLSLLEAEARRRQVSAEFINSIDIKKHIAPVYYPLHDDIQSGAHGYYNLPGGRGSGKSSFIGLEIIKGVMSDKTGHSNAIIFRRTANTLRDSVYSQISWAIDTLNVNEYWQGGVSPMVYTYKPTGAQIIFRGLDDNSKLKSIKPRKGIFKYIWFEEFSELPGENFTRGVLQSVLRGGTGFIVFRSFNPPLSKANWANQFILQADPKAKTLLTNYTQIPPEWLGEGFIYEAERLKEINPAAYANEYMGEATGSGGEVFPNITVREITEQEAAELQYKYVGIDWGFSVDPTAVIQVAYDNRTDSIYFLTEIVKKHCSNTELARLIKEKELHLTGKLTAANVFYDGREPERQTIFADSAEPKSISDLQGEGLRVIACKKYAGSVQYGIKWLQHRRLIIDPKRTPNALKEFTQYVYETTKDGEFLADVPDKDNHLIDATRYSLDRLINHRGVSA